MMFVRHWFSPRPLEEAWSENWKWLNKFKMGLTDNVFICFSDKNAHTYLVVGKYEVHGHLVFKPIRLRRFSYRSVRPGVVVRLNLRPREVRALEAYLRSVEGHHFGNCHLMILDCLDKALGIRLRHTGGFLLSMSRFMSLCVERGFVRGDGRPLSTDIYFVHGQGKLERLRQAKDLDRRFWFLGFFSYLLGLPFSLWRKMRSADDFFSKALSGSPRAAKDP